MATKKKGRKPALPPSPALVRTRARSAPAADPLPPTDPQAAAEWVAAADLHAWPDNPKKPSKDEIRGVADSIIRFGFGAALVARRANLELIAGHTRLLGVGLLPKLWKAAGEAERATWSPDAVRLAQGGDVRLPVRLLDIGEHDAHLLALADNELGAEWDPRLLLGQLEQLKAEERLLAGWTEEEFKKLRGDKPGAVDGDDPGPGDPPKKAVSKAGERYQLGPHVLVCGDSTDPKAWELLLGDERVDLVWTDPPYGVAYVGKTKDALTIQNDKLDPKKLREFLDAAFGAALSRCAPGAAWYVAAPAGPLFGVFGNALEAIGVWRHTLVWLKDQFVMGRCDYHYRHEAVFYGWEPNGPHYWCGARDLDSILEFPRPKRSTEHPTMKPPELIQYCIANSSKPDAIVADPFGGSGSTLIAAAREGRRARLIELDPKYCDVIRKRWGDFARSAGVDPGPGAL